MSGVEIVTVPVTVTDSNDAYVSQLEKTDFRIFDNDKEQKIDSFEQAFLPISMVVLIQSSARVEGILPDVRKTAVLFTDLVLGEFGEAALISYDNRVKLMQDFTNDSKVIDKGLKNVTVGSDAVRLADALYEALRLLSRRPPTHRKIIVAIGESQDNGSEIGLGEALRTAQLNDVMFYAVRLLEPIGEAYARAGRETRSFSGRNPAAADSPVAESRRRPRCSSATDTRRRPTWSRSSSTWCAA